MERIHDNRTTAKFYFLFFLPRSVRDKFIKYFRYLTGPIRTKPDFIIIGAQRSGTTSLYNYIIKHPHVNEALRKEIYFFDNNFNRGVNYYKAFFPTLVYKYIFKWLYKRDLITGEATTGYHYHPHVPKRVFSILPNVKIIMLLRNPTDRAYSHYWYRRKGHKEHLSFEEAIEKEPERLKGEINKMLEDENYVSKNVQLHSYLLRGIYIEQIKNWRKYFRKEQMLIIKSEDLFKNPPEILSEVFKFLGLSNWRLKEYKIHNPIYYKKMDYQII